MMKKLLLLLIISFAGFAATKAQNQYWTPETGPDGGDFSLVKVANGDLFALHYSNWRKTYRSTDQGHTWQELTFLQQFFPNDVSKRVYVGETGTVYLSIPSQQATYHTNNDGQTWLPTFGFDLELASGVMIKVENNLVQRSTNSGQNWIPVLNYPTGLIYSTGLSNTPYGGLLFECKRTVANGDTVSTLYRSFDDGATWAERDVDPALANFFFAPSGTILCTKADTLFRSADDGVSFQSVGQYGIYQLSFAVLNTGRILMEQYGRLQFSDNDGITWSTLTTFTEGSGGTFYPIPPLADGTIFKHYLNALVRSEDGGLTWQFSGIGMHGNITEQMVFASDSVYYANTPIGLWKTNNAGANWNLLHQHTISQSYGNNFGVTASGGVAVVQNNTLLWAADGITYTDITPPHGLDYYNYGAKFSLNPQNDHFFINTKQGLERSTDYGQTWELLLDSNYIYTELGFHPSGRLLGFTAVQGGEELLISDDNGNSWTPKPIPDNPFVSAIRVAPGGDIYLLGAYAGSDTDAFLWKSEDAGETWVKLPTAINLTLWWLPIIEIAANGYIFIAVDQDISLSTNEGVTWQSLPSPVDSFYQTKFLGRIKSIAISPGQHLFAGTANFDLSRSVQPLSFGATIEGFVRLDADADCSTADSQAPLSNRSIQATGDDFTYYTKTDPTGRYSILVDTGAYDVSIYNGHNIWWAYCDSIKTVSLPYYFIKDTADFAAIALSDCPLMTVNVAVPMLRRCFDNAVYVQYCNQGTQPADSAWVDVLLDPYVSFVSSLQDHTDLGNNTIRFWVGDIASGDCAQFNLIVHVNCDSTVLGQTHCITAHGFPDTLCAAVPNWSGANIEANVTCQDTTVHFQLRNTGTAASHALDYIIIEDDVVMLQGVHQYNPGQELLLPVPANGHTMRIESEQEPGHPFSTLAIAFEEGCGGFESLGFINQFTVNGITPSWHRVCRENTGSFDPNDKQGFPIGAGAEHQIRPGQPIEYMIRFQNTGTDTAFTVAVRDTLSPWLDPAAIVPGAASHPYTWQLEGSGVIKFTFSNILLPDSTTNLEASQGFLTFTIDQQQEVPLGTRIFNDAAIFFDFNEPVITNETMHTVGLELLIGAVEPPNPAKVAVQVAPNPAGAVATFQLAKGHFKAHRLQLFDPLGKPVLETEVSGSQYVLPRNNLTAGAYGWRVVDKYGQLVGSGMLVFL